jgi:putative GTP pyrophosphokinase
VKLIEEYKNCFGEYGAFTKCFETLVGTLLREASIRPHSVNGRAKDVKSLEAKINRPNKNYSSLGQITDLCGIRIITYFTEEVDLVAKLIEKEFVVDSKNSVDKRIFSDPDRFGYVSLHYVASLSPARLALAEYRRFDGFKAEIQIRTVIQHAWAEIEHDLGYKRELAIPKTVKRKFFQLAAMLEMADEGFTSIKQTLAEYEKEVGAAIATTPETVEIDATSIREYTNTSPILQWCDMKLSKTLGLPLVDFPPDMPERGAAELRWVGLNTVNELDDFLKANSDIVLGLAVHRLTKHPSEDPDDSLLRGLSLLYVCYVILARRGNVEEFVKFFNTHGFGPEELLEDTAKVNIDFVTQFDKEHLK